jgi:hypothetical protein
MREKPPITFVEYERIFRVLYTVLDDRAVTHRACIFFAVAGANLLREHHRMKADPVSGAAAILVDDAAGNVATFAAIDQGFFLASEDRFHCWVQCDGWIVDFMMPLLKENMRATGAEWAIPRRMFQRPIAEGGSCPEDFNRRSANFVFLPSAERTIAMHANFHARPASEDLSQVCNAWYRRPPRKMPATLDMGDNTGGVTRLKLHGPSIEGAWFAQA